jgi:hypothetical protein
LWFFIKPSKIRIVMQLSMIQWTYAMTEYKFCYFSLRNSKRQFVTITQLFWYKILCWIVNIRRHFGKANCLCLQSQKAQSLGLSIDISVIIYQTTLHEFSETWKLYQTPLRAVKIRTYYCTVSLVVCYSFSGQH